MLWDQPHRPTELETSTVDLRMRLHHTVLQLGQMALAKLLPVEGSVVVNTTTTNMMLATPTAQRHNTEVHQDEQKWVVNLSSAMYKLDEIPG